MTDHEADLSASRLRQATNLLIDVEAYEATAQAGVAYDMILRAEREIRQAQRHIEALKSRFAFDHGLGEGMMSAIEQAESDRIRTECLDGAKMRHVEFARHVVESIGKGI